MKGPSQRNFHWARERWVNRFKSNLLPDTTHVLNILKSVLWTDQCKHISYLFIIITKDVIILKKKFISVFFTDMRNHWPWSHDQVTWYHDQVTWNVSSLAASSSRVPQRDGRLWWCFAVCLCRSSRAVHPGWYLLSLSLASYWSPKHD